MTQFGAIAAVLVMQILLAVPLLSQAICTRLDSGFSTACPTNCCVCLPGTISVPDSGPEGLQGNRVCSFCPAGHYMPQPGQQALCLPCPAGMQCPVGTAVPLPASLPTTPQFDDPVVDEQQTNSHLTYNVDLAFVVIGIILVVTVFVAPFVCVRWHKGRPFAVKLRPLLKSADLLFTLDHHVKWRTSPIRRQTSFGGLTTIASGIVIVLLVIASFVDYNTSQSVTSISPYGAPFPPTGLYAASISFYGGNFSCAGAVIRLAAGGAFSGSTPTTTSTARVGGACVLSWTCPACVQASSSVALEFLIPGPNAWASVIGYSASLPAYTTSPGQVGNSFSPYNVVGSVSADQAAQSVFAGTSGNVPFTAITVSATIALWDRPTPLVGVIGQVLSVVPGQQLPNATDLRLSGGLGAVMSFQASDLVYHIDYIAKSKLLFTAQLLSFAVGVVSFFRVVVVGSEEIYRRMTSVQRHFSKSEGHFADAAREVKESESRNSMSQPEAPLEIVTAGQSQPHSPAAAAASLSMPEASQPVTAGSAVQPPAAADTQLVRTGDQFFVRSHSE